MSKRNPNKIKEGSSVATFLVHALLVVLALICIYPIWYTFIISISSPEVARTLDVFLLPDTIYLGSYEQTLADNLVWSGYANTILYAATCCVGMLAGSAAGIGISLAADTVDMLEGALQPQLTVLIGDAIVSIVAGKLFRNIVAGFTDGSAGVSSSNTHQTGGTFHTDGFLLFYFHFTLIQIFQSFRLSRLPVRKALR